MSETATEDEAVVPEEQAMGTVTRSDKGELVIKEDELERYQKSGWKLK